MIHRSRAELEDGLEEVRRSPRGAGTVELIVRRPAPAEREVVEEAELDPVQGLVGDCWATRGSSSTEDGSANPDCQLTLMNARAVALIAGERENWALAGDQLFVDLDLSPAAVPPGSQLRIGSALIEVTQTPHLGCGKFIRRFGVDALKVVSSPAGRALNLRGINTRVVEGGRVRQGDRVAVAAAQGQDT